MKKSKVFMITGAFALGISAIFATKAHKTFKAVTTGITFNNTNYAFTVLNSSIFTTSNNSTLRVYAQLCTSSGFVVVSPIALYTDKIAHVPILYK